MRLSLKIINDEVAKRGHTARLAKGDGYFYFQFGEAADWLDRTVRVRTINSLMLKEPDQQVHLLAFGEIHIGDDLAQDGARLTEFLLRYCSGIGPFTFRGVRDRYGEFPSVGHLPKDGGGFWTFWPF